MRTRVFVTVALTALVLCQARSAMAQSTAEKMRQVREEISKREKIDVPDNLKGLNQSVLTERRTELKALLNTEIDKLKQYQSALGPSLTAEEGQKLQASIQSFQTEIDALSAGIVTTSAVVTPTTPPPVAAQTPAPIPLVTSNAAATVTSTPLDCKEVNAPGGDKKIFSQLDLTVCGLVRDNLQRRQLSPTDPEEKKLIINSSDFFKLVVVMIAKRQTPGFLVDAEEKRLDKQVGGAPSNPGSTSLVVKGGVPAILGFAVENGGLTQSLNGTAVTFRGNPVGLFNAFANKGFVPSVKADEDDPLVRFLKKTSFAFTFNTDRGDQPGVFTATKQQLSSFSTRFEFINNRRPERYLRDWEDFLKTTAQQFSNSINQRTPILINTSGKVGRWHDTALQTWFDETNAALVTAGDGDVESIIKSRLEKLPLSDLSPETIMQLNGIERELGVYVTARQQLLDKINSGTVVTFEYLNKREVNAPDTSNFTFIAEKGTGGGKIDFTFNGSLTMFNNLGSLRNFVSLNPTLPAPRRLRDFQFAGQMDVPLGNVMNFGEFVFFAGGRYERLLENASNELGQVLPNTKGDVGFLQLGLKVPIKGTGIKIPFSVTFANRTELVKEQTVRGNFGFTLDLDMLFGRFKPF